MMPGHLVIMAKAPVMGRAKTRLASGIGGPEAMRVYRRLLADTLRRLTRDRRWRTWLAVSPDRHLADPTWPCHVARIGQGAGDLGTRMQRLFDTLPPGPAVIVGADIPGIEPQDIAEGLRALGDHDAVFGPATDGGYWLVGQRRAPARLAMFDQVRWSTRHALSDTLANLAGCRVATIRQIADIDEARDYLDWRAGNRT